MTTQTLKLNCTVVVSNAKTESIQLTNPVKETTPPTTNTVTVVVKDPALMGQFKAGKNYTVTFAEVPATV